MLNSLQYTELDDDLPSMGIFRCPLLGAPSLYKLIMFSMNYVIFLLNKAKTIIIYTYIYIYTYILCMCIYIYIYIYAYNDGPPK